MNIVLFLILSKSGHEPFQPFIRQVSSKRDIERISTRHGPHCRDVRQTDPEQFARDKISGLVTDEMHSLDNCVSGNDEGSSWAGRDRRSIVGQSIGAPEICGERRKVIGYPFELTLAHRRLPPEPVGRVRR